MPIKIDVCKCIVCGTRMPNQNQRDLHPNGGACFQAKGNYGSAVCDDMQGTQLEIVICDGCLMGMSGPQGFILRIAKLPQDNAWFEPDHDVPPPG